MMPDPAPWEMQVPPELAQRRQWVVWKHEVAKGRHTKVPYQALNPHKRAETDDPSTWASLEEATAAAEPPNVDGIGFVLSDDDNVVFIDIDNGMGEDGRAKPWARDILRALDSYTELSISGRGFHVLLLGKLDGKRHRTQLEDGEVELYDTKRYLTFTGRPYPGFETLRERQDALNLLYTTLFPPTPEPAPQPSPARPELSDLGILDRARESKQGPQFSALYDHGDTSAYNNDESRADLALCDMLAFWAGGDQERIDSLFRNSRLMRLKWDERRGAQTYGELTISKALEGKTDFYTPPEPATEIRHGPGVTVTAEALPWITARQLAASTPAEVSWLWQDFMPFGNVCELDAKMKAGKTTLVGHLLRSILEGRPFIGRPTMSCPVVYLTEEGDRSFRALLVRAGLIERDDIHILSKRKVPTLKWEELVEAAKQKVKLTGAGLLIVDTLGKMAGFQDDQENSSGQAMKAMNPIQAVASELNIVVLVLRHERKAGGDVGDSARGSSAFGGDVDVIIQMTRVGGQGRQTRRRLRTMGRYDELPAEITIELGEEGYREVTETDAVDAAGDALLEMLPLEEDEAIAVVDLLDDLKKSGHTRPIVYRAIDALAEEERLGKTKITGPSGRKRVAIWRRSSHGGT